MMMRNSILLLYSYIYPIEEKGGKHKPQQFTTFPRLQVLRQTAKRITPESFAVV